jgi:acyl-CoA thioester hydrolase
MIEDVVTADYIDANSHMNIRHYFALGGRAMSLRFRELGIGSSSAARTGTTMFSAEHHLRYLAECLLGHELSAHVRLLGRSTKGLHLMVLIVNRSTGVLAGTMEAATVHIDSASRRPAGFSDDVCGVLDAAIAEDAHDWPAPVCGAMGPSRR